MESLEEWQFRPPWVTNLQLEKMNWAGGFVFLVLVFFVTSQTAGASQLNADGNYTETGNATDGGSVPAVFTSVSQIIAREGSCTLIDCNVTGEPFPSVQWFNSHGHRVDTSGEIDFFFKFIINPVSCSHFPIIKWSHYIKAAHWSEWFLTVFLFAVTFLFTCSSIIVTTWG